LASGSKFGFAVLKDLAMKRFVLSIFICASGMEQSDPDPIFARPLNSGFA
jgi:hypothetical protein